MQKILSIFLLGIITLSMQSCSQEKPQSTSPKNPSTPPSKSAQIPAKPASNTIPSNPATAAASTPAQASQKIRSTQQTAGLIPSTNPDRRIQASLKGRKDPFAFVSMMAKIKIPAKKASEVAAKPNKPQNLPKIPVQNTPVLEPVRSEPTLANSVAVTGVMDIGGILKAIVQAPEEEASRYVEVGQYLSNGQILVKNIDTSDPLNPSVVLEQAGVQVSKKVGEASQANAGNTQALAY
jgi:Tfp pilus assembly protein PilP